MSVATILHSPVVTVNDRTDQSGQAFSTDLAHGGRERYFLRLALVACVLDAELRRDWNLIVQKSAVALSLILALAATAEDLERFRECVQVSSLEQCTPEITRLRKEVRERERERWRSQCVDDANLEQCVAEKEARHETREQVAAEEVMLISLWLYDVLPQADTKAEMEYKVHAISGFGGLKSELYDAGFRLCPAIRQAVKSRLDRLQEIRALDDDAADAYLDKLLTGDPTLPRIPLSCP